MTLRKEHCATFSRGASMTVEMWVIAVTTAVLVLILMRGSKEPEGPDRRRPIPRSDATLASQRALVQRYGKVLEGTAAQGVRSSSILPAPAAVMKKALVAVAAHEKACGWTDKDLAVFMYGYSELAHFIDNGAQAESDQFWLYREISDSDFAGLSKGDLEQMAAAAARNAERAKQSLALQQEFRDALDDEEAPLRA